MNPLNMKSGLPIWEQVFRELKKQILCGILPAGEQLPSVRSLAAELGINPNTLFRAYSELERAGLTYTVSGIGSFVNDKMEEIRHLSRENEKASLTEAIINAKNGGLSQEEVSALICRIYEEGKE